MLILAKIKSLISILEKQPNLKFYCVCYRNAFAKGRCTYIEIERCNFKTCILSKIQEIYHSLTLAKTIEGCLVMLKK
jgi:hypothetical protein